MNMKFKNYPRKYEKVFSDPEELKKKCNIEKVTAFNNIPGNISVYLRLFQDTAWKFQMDLFNNLVKLEWLKRRFCYKGVHRVKKNGNGFKNLEQPYGLFMRGFAGISNKTLYASSTWLGKLVNYFDELFPNFNTGNPFEEKYEYPFEFMNIDCLLLVNKMPERMDLLQYGESQKMNYLQFTDYVINYINCYNDEHGHAWEYVFSGNSCCWIRPHKDKYNKYE